MQRIRAIRQVKESELAWISSISKKLRMAKMSFSRWAAECDRSEWKFITAVVDSGSVRPVIPPDVLPEIKVQPTEESKSGHSFRGAKKNGTPIRNLGEQVVLGITAEGQRRKMRWTVSDVRKPLISVTKLEEAGNEIVLGKRPRIVHLKTGQATNLKKQSGVYTLDL